jgi:hypothetical protein
MAPLLRLSVTSAEIKGDFVIPEHCILISAEINHMLLKVRVLEFRITRQQDRCDEVGGDGGHTQQTDCGF